MIEFALRFIFFGCLEALFMEVYKKRFRGDGTVTHASRYELWIVGALIALAYAVGMCLGDDMGMGWYALIPYSLAMYALQFVLSMKLVKAIMKRFLPKE